MSSKAHRRRPKPSATTKQAFEEHENENRLHTEQVSDKPEPSSINTPSSKSRDDEDQLYEKAFFTINDLTVEVILNNNILTWLNVSSQTSIETIHSKKSVNKDDTNSVDLRDVYAVTPIYQRSTWVLNNNESPTTMTVSNLSTTEALLRGFQLHTYERMDDNILQEVLIIFQSILPDQIEQWYQLLLKLISKHKPAQNVLVICNPYAGSKSSRHVYNIKIRPLFERARYNITYLEMHDLCSADEVLTNFHGDFDSLYGLVIMGGDGSVINVINALIRYLAKENRTRLDTENDLPSIPFPISIVPIGTTNIICHSIHGNTDHSTPMLHLLFNHRMKIDMSAIFDDSYNFVTANFSAGAGYPANVLKYFPRYSSLNSKKIIQKSFAKATSTKNLIPIEMEIRYVPADQNTVSTTRCYQSCPSCTPTAIEQMDNQVKAFDDDHLQKISKRKKPSSSDNGKHQRPSSSKKTSNQQNEVEKNWKILHQNYLQVAVLTNANLWSFAPQGLSKFGHIADGLLDLILIEPTSRKDFLRYLKRNGNSKDQYDFAFTNIIKVKEIEIKLLTDEIFNTDNQLDSSLSDDLSNDEHSNNENKLSTQQKHQPHPPSAPISEKSRHHRRRHHQLNEQAEEPSITRQKENRNQQQKYSDNELDNASMDGLNSNISNQRKNIFQSIKSKKEKVPLPRPSSVCGNERLDEKQHRKSRQATSGTLRPARSFLSLLMGGNSSSGKQDSSSITMNNSNGRRASIISRSSSMENVKTLTSTNDHQYRNKKQPCLWNLDFTPYHSPLIRMKCFYRFLPVFGVGINPDTMIREVNYSCFGRIG